MQKPVRAREGKCGPPAEGILRFAEHRVHVSHRLAGLDCFARLKSLTEGIQRVRRSGGKLPDESGSSHAAARKGRARRGGEIVTKMKAPTLPYDILRDSQTVIHRILLKPIADGFPTVVARGKEIEAPAKVEIQAAANQSDCM